MTQRRNRGLRPALIALTVLFALAAALLCTAACAEEAADLTQDCKLKSSGTKRRVTLMTDGKYTSYWETNKAKHNYVEIHAPSGKKIHGVYLCFRAMPDGYEVQRRSGSGWETVAVGDPTYYHAYHEIAGGTAAVRIYCPSNKSQVLGFNEVFAFGEGETPDWVQRWEPTVEKADILFLSTHPDDELIFFAGGIPTAVDQGRSVAVAYLSYSNTTRRSELLNGLWAMGVRNYPIIGTFRDSYQNSKNKQEQLKKQIKALGGQAKLDSWTASVIRRTKPEVIVTQDVDGEYGHPMHKVLVATLQGVCRKTGDASFDPESAQTYGVWEAKKVYLHLWPENSSRFDWEQPLETFGGKTGMEMASYAYSLHVTQRTSGMSVEETGAEYDNHLFGLYYSTVGPDETGGDFFEHIDAAQPRTEAAETAETTETAKTAEETAPEAPGTAEAAADPEPDMPAEDGKTWVPEEDIAALLPELTPAGYLAEGEFVHASEDEGIYIYIGQTLRVIIRRTLVEPDKRHYFHCFTADIWCDVEKGELPHTIFVDPEKPKSAHAFIKTTATEHQSVFATSTDYYTYRIKQPYPTGIEIRSGVILFDEPRAKPPLMPNYETIAFFPDGRLESHASTEMSAQDYLKAGAYDVYTFGPCLVRDGEVTQMALDNPGSYEPRYAFGMVEPGHYVAMLCEGRVARSKGAQKDMVAKLMQEHGCQLAVNLDGGQTAVFCFMGKQINQIVKSDPYGRKQAEILSFGTSPQVGTFTID
ncbi:MAG: phosphodiester glycosidase family protein [Clostridia bacterium]|nr:phosphodiester glycosidase family protein [Clostridia bacterium]